MSFDSMSTRLTGYVPKLPLSEARNLVQSAWREVRNNRLWSFQLFEDSFTPPSLVTGGTYTLTLGSNQVVADAAASAVLAAVAPQTLITRMQFRVQGLTIYSIIAFTLNAGVYTLTLDRVVTDPPGAGQNYMIYMAYLAAPYADFKRWVAWRDMTNADWLDIYATRKEWDQADPQRLYFTFPHYVLPMGSDIRGAGTSTPSPTLGYPMYELYPHAIQPTSYMRWGIRSGADLDTSANPTLPYPMDDGVVFPLARLKAYEWAEGNRDPATPRGQTADYRFMAGAAKAEYETNLKQVGMKDRDICDLYLQKIRQLDAGMKPAFYNSLTGRAYAGT